jgi:hypothetical protein
MTSQPSSVPRTLWIANVLEVVAQFASEEFQISAWIGFNGPEGASFEEAYSLLEDFGLENALKSAGNLRELRPSEKRVL